MQKIIFLMSLVIASGCEQKNTGWIKYGESLEADLYANPSTIHKNGDIATFWELTDYKSPQNSITEHIDFEGAKNKYSSAKHQLEYNCATKEQYLIYSIYFSENMGEGRIIYLKPYDANEFLAFDIFGGMRSYEFSISRLSLLEKNPNVRLSNFYYKFGNSRSVSYPFDNLKNSSLGKKIWERACGNVNIR